MQGRGQGGRAPSGSRSPRRCGAARAPLGLAAVGPALAVDRQAMPLPVEVPAGETGELGDPQPGVEERPDDQALLVIPAGSQSGAKLRMKGKGAPDPKKGMRGDMYVHLQIVVPKAAGPKEREIFEALKGLESDPRAGKF